MVSVKPKKTIDFLSLLLYFIYGCFDNFFLKGDRRMTEELEKLLAPFKHRFYQSLESDFTTRNGFQHAKELKMWTKAPDWDPSSYIRCGSGLHVVQGHPLFTHEFVRRNNPIYAEVITDPTPPVPSAENSKKYRAEKLMKLRIVSAADPEFDSRILELLVREHINGDISDAAVMFINTQDTLKSILMDEHSFRSTRLVVFDKMRNKNFSNKELDALWRIDSWELKQRIVKFLDATRYHKYILRALRDYDEDVRVAGIKKLHPEKDAEILTKIIQKKRETYSVLLAAVERIKFKGNKDVISMVEDLMGTAVGEWDGYPYDLLKRKLRIAQRSLAGS